MEPENIRLLIVEDDEAHGELITMEIEARAPSWIIKLATSIEEAKADIETFKPQVLITDWRLPDGTGIDFLKDLKKDLPTILMSSCGNEAIAVESIKLGAIDYIVKSPENFANMHRIISRVLREWDNISQLKIAQKALKESESLYRMTIDGIKDFIHVVNKEFRLVLYNESYRNIIKKATGEDDLYGKTIFEVQPFLPEHIYEEYNKVLNTGLPLITVDRIQVNEVDFFWTETRKFPIFDSRGQVVQILTVIRDITDSKIAEEERINFEKQLQHTQKLESLGIMAGGIAHDFNNLLMAILGNADLARLEMSPASPGCERIVEIEKAARRAAELCHQMLAYSGKGKFVIQHLNINDVIKEMLHMLDVSISKKAALRFNFDEKLPLIEGDVTQIRQIIMNLIINASEAIEDKNGIISINTGSMMCDEAYLKTAYVNEDLKNGLYVYVEVSDTGCGMSKETQNKIFDPFFSTKFTGRGLGLAAALGIVRGHKGVIKVYSEINKGTCFKVFFPASIENEEKRKESNIKNAEWKGKGTILLVDDENLILNITGLMLKRLGFNVLTASDGLEAIKIFKEKNDITCIILDLTMPHMDGTETFRELTNTRQDVPIILSSGYNEQEVSQKFAGRSPAGFIQKPYTVQILTDKLKEILGTDNF